MNAREAVLVRFNASGNQTDHDQFTFSQPRYGFRASGFAANSVLKDLHNAGQPVTFCATPEVAEAFLASTKNRYHWQRIDVSNDVQAVCAEVKSVFFYGRMALIPFKNLDAVKLFIERGLTFDPGSVKGSMQFVATNMSDSLRSVGNVFSLIKTIDEKANGRSWGELNADEWAFAGLKFATSVKAASVVSKRIVKPILQRSAVNLAIKLGPRAGTRMIPYAGWVMTGIDIASLLAASQTGKYVGRLWVLCTQQLPWTF